MNIGTYDVGDQPQITATFANAQGAVTDPTTVKFVTRGAGTETVYTYPTSPEIAKTSTGVYKLTMPQITAALASSIVYIRANGTGTVVASDEDYIAINATAYVTPLP